MGLFGRGKDNKVGRVCTECGRTLLAGEWTQRSVGDDGEGLPRVVVLGQAGGGVGVVVLNADEPPRRAAGKLAPGPAGGVFG